MPLHTSYCINLHFYKCIHSDKSANQLPAKELSRRLLHPCINSECSHAHINNCSVLAAILFCLIVALCTFGIVHATNAHNDVEVRQARDAAHIAADGLSMQLSSASRAALSLVGVIACVIGHGGSKGGGLQLPRMFNHTTLQNPASAFMDFLQAAVVKMNPDWPFLESNFHVLAEELFRQSNEEGNLALMELTLVPFGRVRASLGKPVQRNSTADLFSSDFISEFKPYETMELSGLDIKGPNPLINSEDFSFTA
eukprot:scaffold36256_cov16-Tisochrysis_lutea.AAC.1